MSIVNLARRLGAAFLFCVLLAASPALAQFTQQGPQLVPADALPNVLLGGPGVGSSVALSADGNTMLLGAPFDGLLGATFVYTRSGGVWTEQAKLVFSVPNVLPLFAQGVSVALSADGNTAAIGDDGDNGNLGAVFILTRSGTTWSGLAKIAGSTSQGRIGRSVALSADGNTLVAGGAQETFVYIRNAGAWVQQSASLTGSDATGDPLERTVAISGDGNTLIYGQRGDDNFAGAAFVFTRSGGVWTQQGSKLVGTGAVGAAQQGTQVALSFDGSVAAISGSFDDGNRGAVWTFTRSAGVWTQQGSKVVGSDANSQGNAISLSGNGRELLIGGVNAGWHFRRCGGGWSQVGRFTAAGGAALALSGDGLTAVFGTPNGGNLITGNIFLPPSPISPGGTGPGPVPTGAGLAFTQPELPSFTVCPGTDIASAGFPGGPFTPSQFNYVLRNTGGSATNYSILGVPDWLDASSTSGTINTDDEVTITFTVNATAATKTVGVYAVTIDFINATNHFGDTSRTATLTVNPPELIVSPSSNIASSGNVGGPFAPASFDYTLSSTAGSVGYSITGVPSWLTASSTGGSAGTGGTTVTFTVNANAAALAAGTYGPDTITFTNTSTSLGNTTRTATLTVLQPSLSVAAASNIAASGPVGGPFAPGSFQYTLTATNADVPYTITGVPSWLTASSTSGTVSTASPATITFTVNASANALAAGSYGPATVTFTNTAGGAGNTTRTATLNVSQFDTATMLTSSVNASQARQKVTFTATVSGGGTPTGMVTFKVDGTIVATETLASGKARYSTDALTLGKHAIVARYSGGGPFVKSNSSVLQQSVNPHVGLEFRLNTHSGGAQPAAAGLARGGFVAGWASTDATRSGIYGQRYDKKGDQSGEEFRVTARTAKNPQQPSIAALKDGGFVFVWQADADDSGTAAFGQRYAKNGAKAGSEFRVSAGQTPVRQTRPRVASLDTGGFVVVWLTDFADASFGSGVFVQLFDQDAKAVGPMSRADPGNSVMRANPSVTGRAGGGFAVAWEEARGAAADIQTYVCRFDAGCPIATDAVTFRVGGGGAKKQTVPVLAGLTDGGFIVAWQSDVGDGSGSAVYAQRFDKASAKALDAFRVNTMKTNDQWQPSVTGLADGGYVVSWSSAGQDGSGQGVYAQAYNAAGPQAFTEYRVNTTVAGDQWQSASTAFVDGKLVVVWTSTKPDGSENVFGQRFDLMGVTAAQPAAAAR